MQKYQSIISGTNGSVIRNVPVTVLKEDGSLAEIFLDREGQVPAPNPLVTDSRGVFYFYAVNGRYSLRTSVDGITITDADAVLLNDPEEIATAGPIADAVLRAEAAAQRAEDAVEASGIPELVGAAQNAVEDAQQAVSQAGVLTEQVNQALIDAQQAKLDAESAAQTAASDAANAAAAAAGGVISSAVSAANAAKQAAEQAQEGAEQAKSDAQQTSAEISIKVEAAQSAQAGAEAAQAGAEAVLENAVQQTSDTGAALLPEGTDAQRPATGNIPAGALVMRGNTQTVGDYIAEYWDRGASAWRALASRLWASHVFATRNEVINGCFQINQRAYASGAVTTSGQYTLDRWKVTGAAGITFSTVENKTTVTIPAGQTLQQVIEGLNLQSGPYVLSWEGSAKGRIGAGAYGDSGVSANLVGGTNATIEFNAGTLTNVRLDFGFASPGVRLPNFNEERRRCLRYYRTSYVGVKAGTISSAGAAVGGPYSNDSAGPFGAGCILANFDMPMRVAPTVSLYSPGTGAANNVYDTIDRPATVNALSMMGFYVGYDGNGSFVGTVHYVADAELA